VAPLLPLFERTYCGVPPSPGALAARWNLDPVLIAGLLAVVIGYAVMAEPRLTGRWTLARSRRASFYVGWALGALALTSPLCALSVSLFSARVGQHMLLTTVVAPLIALGLPGAWRFRSAAAAPLAAAVFAVVLWIWHAPGPYAATFVGPAVYWTMHLTLFAAALAFWVAVFDRPAERLAGLVAAAAITSLQMGLLGAILTFTGHPLYAAHRLTTAAWGLTPLADQQLGGAIMWIPAGLILVGAVVAAMAMAMNRGQHEGIACASRDPRAHGLR
jgi:putative membrane protein